MAAKYSLTPLLRMKLKQPLGVLIRGSFDETSRKFRELVEKERPPYIISVGDTVSRNLARNRVSPRLSIVDNMCMRKSTPPASLLAEKTIFVRNPQGTITDEAIEAIQKALDSNRSVKMIVDGEEDLLALIAIEYAQENSFVLYGQPYEGIVVVRATSDKKREIAGILGAMEQHQKTK